MKIVISRGSLTNYLTARNQIINEASDFDKRRLISDACTQRVCLCETAKYS